MRILIIKTSSMGDVIHTLPALTDAGQALPHVRFDWVVEEHFAEIPRWHPFVNTVIPIAFRRWRKNIFSQKTWQEWRQFRSLLQSNEYDVVLDAQGLLKSAFIALHAKGKRAGLSFRSAREPLASLFYHHVTTTPKKQHAIARLRQLFSDLLGYDNPIRLPDYGINRQIFYDEAKTRPYILFLHGTTWATKYWPEIYWFELAKKLNDKGFLIKLPWGNENELASAKRIAENCHEVEILPRLDLKSIAKVLAMARAVIAVDTGLGHLAAALDVPTISLYGPTDPLLTGTQGRSQQHLVAKFPCSPCLSRKCRYQSDQSLNSVMPPCFTTVTPDVVLATLDELPL